MFPGKGQQLQKGNGGNGGKPPQPPRDYLPHETHSAPREQPRQTPPPKPSSNQSESFAYKLWNFADVNHISEMADQWANGIRNGLSRNAYLVISIILALFFWFLALVFDLMPSFDFATAWAENGMFANFVKYGLTATQIHDFKLYFIFGFTLVPTLLEFFGTGLALGGMTAINWGIKIFVLFDVVTDLPASIVMGTWIANYFIPDLGLPNTLFKIVASTIWLGCSTLFFETIAITFSVATWRMFRPSRR